jgi:hypothetical protein
MGIPMRVGWRPNPASGSSLMTSVYAVYNADTVRSASLKTSLYAVYNGESNASDSIGSNNGTVVGGLTYASGKIGTAFSFNGTNSYIQLPQYSMRFTNSFSISCWTYTTANQTGYKALIGDYYYSGGDYGYTISISSANKVSVFVVGAGGTPYGITSVVTLSNNQWNNIAVVWDKASTNLKLYVNGTLDTSLTTALASTITYAAGSNRTNIGTSNSSPASGIGAGVFNGLIDAMTVWNRILTQSDITELYNSGNGAQYIADNFYTPNINDSKGTNNGTAIGGLTYGVGKVGTAFQFNGTNAYVNLPNSSGQFNFTGDFSVSMWFKSSNLSTSRYAIGNYKSGGSNGYGWLLFYSVVGGFAFDLRNGNNINQVRNTQTINTNTWYHVVAVRKMGQIHKLYVNGVDVSAPQTDGNVNNIAGYTANQPMDLGGLSDANAPALCDLDGVNMWNKALTQSEITELYNSGNGKQYPY